MASVVDFQYKLSKDSKIMINANELRLGNYYLAHVVDTLDRRKEWDEPCKIDFSDFEWLFNNPNDEEYKPIKITEKILKDNGVLNLRINGFCLYKRNDNTFYFADFNGNSIDMNFVHDLQNFYFAHKRSELALSFSTEP